MIEFLIFIRDALLAILFSWIGLEYGGPDADTDTAADRAEYHEPAETDDRAIFR